MTSNSTNYTTVYKGVQFATQKKEQIQVQLMPQLSD